jgi:hypothetical protein
MSFFTTTDKRGYYRKLSLKLIFRSGRAYVTGMCSLNNQRFVRLWGKTRHCLFARSLWKTSRRSCFKLLNWRSSYEVQQKLSCIIRAVWSSHHPFVLSFDPIAISPLPSVRLSDLVAHQFEWYVRYADLLKGDSLGRSVGRAVVRHTYTDFPVSRRSPCGHGRIWTGESTTYGLAASDASPYLIPSVISVIRSVDRTELDNLDWSGIMQYLSLFYCVKVVL